MNDSAASSGSWSGSARIFGAFFKIGLQSWGGGAATLFLIRQTVVEREGWLDPALFSRYHALCPIAPGLNLIALSALVGRRVAGALGIVAAIMGLLLPCLVIAISLTALYDHYRDTAVVRAALRGVIPATVGISLLTTAQIGLPLLREAVAQGRGNAVTALIIPIAVAVGLWSGKLPVIALLVGAAVAAALSGVVVRRHKLRRNGARPSAAEDA